MHDTHFHLDLYPSRQAVLEETERAGIYTIAVTNAPSVFKITQDLVRGKKYWRAALGLHPELVASHGGELQLFRSLLPETKYVGEVGLDYSIGTSEEKATQRKIFGEIVELCESNGGRIVTIHSRRAEKDVVATLENKPRSAFILHWYSGSLSSLKKAGELGVWLSVNTAMAKSTKAHALVDSVPRHKILLESDGPFINVSGHPARPINVSMVVAWLSTLWCISEPETVQQLQSNFRNLLSVVDK
ncbi:Qat anti-phage system TatD family nuclease QatD [Deinococcus petrolearius]|uniref:Qat anti-phage system TatD family nuclease QatD n=1 Tax=Deinococcus petrolearius TaxID=1751295 RepID=A0ABW1DQN4_9DEIO